MTKKSANTKRTYRILRRNWRQLTGSSSGTGKEKVKQLVSIKLLLETMEYHADVYYNSKTNEYACADFPEGVVDDVNYDGSVKAFLYLLNNECSTSIDKTQRFLCDLTGGRLKISKGTINKLCRTFSKKAAKSLRNPIKACCSAR